MLLKVDCLPNAVGKQPSIPLIYLGRKWTKCYAVEHLVPNFCQQAKQQLHSKLAEDQSHAEEEKRSKDHQRAMQTAIEKHNSKLNCSSVGIAKGASSADALVDKTSTSTASSSVVRSQDGPSTSQKSNPDS